MAVQPINAAIEQQARLLAADNRQAEPDITGVFWFPDEREVRLVELTDQVPANGDGEVRPFYFQPSPNDGLPLPSGIAMIRPDEFGRLRLPADWGNWEDAVAL